MRLPMAWKVLDIMALKILCWSVAAILGAPAVNSYLWTEPRLAIPAIVLFLMMASGLLVFLMWFYQVSC